MSLCQNCVRESNRAICVIRGRLSPHVLSQPTHPPTLALWTSTLLLVFSYYIEGRQVFTLDPRHNPGSSSPQPHSATSRLLNLRRIYWRPLQPKEVRDAEQHVFVFKMYTTFLMITHDNKLFETSLWNYHWFFSLNLLGFQLPGSGPCQFTSQQSQTFLNICFVYYIYLFLLLLSSTVFILLKHKKVFKYTMRLQKYSFYYYLLGNRLMGLWLICLHLWLIQTVELLEWKIKQKSDSKLIFTELLDMGHYFFHFTSSF